MKEMNSWYLAAIVSALFLVIAAFAAWFGFDSGFATLLLYIFGGTLIFFFPCRYLLEYFVFKRIYYISRSVENSLKKRKKIHTSTTPGVERLELAVLQLLQEKTSEIDQLKELERYRKEFLGDVAHELRSPIFNIIGYVDTLLDGAWQDPEVNIKFLQKAAGNVEHLRTLVEDLVTISRIESGEINLAETDFDLTQLTAEVIELLELQARDKKINIIVKTDEGLEPIANADRSKIRQVLSNLIGNSIKYGREGGQTTVKFKHSETKGKITIEVADNGEGIAEQDLPRVFERFYRADKARSRKQVSTGLGLAIVKHFIEAHGQKIWATSHEGVGSIFSFTLAKAKI